MPLQYRNKHLNLLGFFPLLITFAIHSGLCHLDCILYLFNIRDGTPPAITYISQNIKPPISDIEITQTSMQYISWDMSFSFVCTCSSQRFVISFWPVPSHNATHNALCLCFTADYFLFTTCYSIIMSQLFCLLTFVWPCDLWMTYNFCHSRKTKHTWAK